MRFLRFTTPRRLLLLVSSNKLDMGNAYAAVGVSFNAEVQVELDIHQHENQQACFAKCQCQVGNWLLASWLLFLSYGSMSLVGWVLPVHGSQQGCISNVAALFWNRGYA